jgi:hypothetical protein
VKGAKIDYRLNPSNYMADTLGEKKKLTESIINNFMTPTLSKSYRMTTNNKI